MQRILSPCYLLIILAAEFSSPVFSTEPVLIFSSGFEGVEVTPGNWRDADANRHYLTGTDRETGYDWENSWAPYLEDSFFQYCIVKDADRDIHVTTQIQENPHPSKEGPNHVLYIGVKGDDPKHKAMTRNELNLYANDTFTQAYGRYWMKYHPDMEERIQHPTWIMVMEWKEPPDPLVKTGGSNNWRANVTLQTFEDGSLAWQFLRQEVKPQRISEQSILNRAAPIPFGEWFLVETFWRWGKDGRIWYAINGETIFDQHGRFEHQDNPLGLQFWAPFKNYRGKDWYDDDLTNGDESWFIYDDFEVWSDFPADHPMREKDKSILHIDTFDRQDTDWGELPEGWFFEGVGSGARSRVEFGRLQLKADRKDQAGTLWLDKKLHGNLEIEFDVRVDEAVDQSNNMNFFLMFRDPTDRDLFDTRHARKGGDYSFYTRGSLEGIVLTCVANGDQEKARHRMRCVPPFDPVLDEHYGYHAKQDVNYHFRIRLVDNTVTYFVDGIEILKGTPESFNTNTTGGYIGFRTWQTDLSWDNLVIRKLP